MKNFKERLRKIKELEEKKEEKLFDLIKGSPIGIPLEVLEKIFNKLESIEVGAEKNQKLEEIKKYIEEQKINAGTVDGMKSKDFSLVEHFHKEFESFELFSTKEELNNFIKKNSDCIKNIENLLNTIFKNYNSLSKKDFSLKITNLKKSIDTIKKELESHSNLSNLEWSKSGHTIDKDIDLRGFGVINLKNPKKGTDATNKDYVDMMAQRAVGISRVGIPAGSPTTPVYYTRAEINAMIITDHGGLGGLTDDDHTQYALLAGRAGGQTLIGGINAGDRLSLSSSSNAIKGLIDLGEGTTSAGTALGNASTVEINGYFNSPFFGFGEYQNFLQQTEAFNTIWAVTNLAAIVANNAISPISTLVAENIPAETVPDGTGQIYQAVTNSTTGNWCFSVWLKAQSGTATINLRIDSSGGAGGETGTDKSINLTTAWKRYYVTQALTTGHTTKTVRILNAGNAIVAWGAQLEPTLTPRMYSSSIATATQTTLLQRNRIRGATTIDGTLALLSTLAVSGTANFSSLASVNRGAIEATSADGYVLQNTTAALVGVPVQMSPRLRYTGTVWDTGSTSSKTVNFKEEVLPISGNPGTARLLWSYDFNAGGYTELMSLLSNGNLGLGVVAPSAVIHLKAGTATASTAPLKFTTGVNLTAPEAGTMEYNNTFHLTNSDATRRHIATAPNNTKITAGAPYTNDGYVVMNIGGTDFKVMTTT